jgi:hypothetical protein
MDLSKLEIASASEEGTRIEIYHPITEQSFEPPIYVWVVGVDSQLYQKTALALQNKAMKKMIKSGRLRMSMTAEEQQANNIELYAKCTVNWENVEWEGKPLLCNFENVRMVLNKLPWLREQIETAISDRSLFLQD